MNINQLKFPIGEYKPNKSPSRSTIDTWISDIERFPVHLDTTLDKCTPVQLNWRYRPEGWTIKQVVHHCADSHMNSFIRFRLALTEDNPTIRPYMEDRWAELTDSKTGNITDSMIILKGLHSRWTMLLRTLTDSDLARCFIHPEHRVKITLVENIGIYSWHCNHHLAHIKQALQSQGKYNTLSLL